MRPRRAHLARLAVVVCLLGVAIATIVIATGTSERSRPRSRLSHASAIEREVSSLLAGIPQSSNTLGRPSAPVTLRWFGDMECPYCKQFALGALPSLIRRWVQSGRLKIEYLSLQTATREPKVFKAQELAALAAGMQNRMWNYIETFFHEQGEEGSGYVTEGYLRNIAHQIAGMDQPLWVEDRHNPQLATRLAASLRVAVLAGLRSTPAFLISRHGARVDRLSPRSLTNPRSFNAAIEYLLNEGRSGRSQYVQGPRHEPARTVD